MKIIKAPHTIRRVTNGVFLAGSIEMGKAENWQDAIANLCESVDVTFFNPRRDDWDSSWVQSIHDDNFREQVQWELKALDRADKIVFYFDPNTQSPITLMELGYVTRYPEKVCVCCPDGFWRKGNVEIMCDRFKIPMVDDIHGLVKFIKQ